MLPLVTRWLDRNCHPIGIDFGSACLRTAQINAAPGGLRLLAAASVDVPPSIRDDRGKRLTFLTDMLADQCRTAGFHGRRVVLVLPAAATFIRQLSPSPGDDKIADEAVMETMRDDVDIAADDMLIRRHAVPRSPIDRQDVIAIIASRSAVVDLLQAVRGAGLDVISMNTEPGALVDFYNHTYIREGDRNTTVCIIDIGFGGTRMTVAREGRLTMAHTIPLGGRRLTQAVADGLCVDFEQGLRMRWKHACGTSGGQAIEKHLLYRAPPRSVDGAMHREQNAVHAAAHPVISALTREIENRRRQFESSPAGSPIDRLVFVGGESRDRRLCERIARCLGITAVTGDPLLRMSRESDACIPAGIDRRLPQPAWAVAFGASLGPCQLLRRGLFIRRLNDSRHAAGASMR